VPDKTPEERRLIANKASRKRTQRLAGLKAAKTRAVNEAKRLRKENADLRKENANVLQLVFNAGLIVGELAARDDMDSLDPDDYVMPLEGIHEILKRLKELGCPEAVAFIEDQQEVMGKQMVESAEKPDI
jgi:phosphoglycolate phosphatase-like HAD superfamily hydrolase